jgi:hypothetical protein
MDGVPSYTQHGEPYTYMNDAVAPQVQAKTSPLAAM